MASTEESVVRGETLLSFALIGQTAANCPHFLIYLDGKVHQKGISSVSALLLILPEFLDRVGCGVGFSA